MFRFAALLCLLFVAGICPAADVEFNYTGTIKVSGTPFTGAGQFKFALVNQAGNTTYWSHDGTSVNGGQPTGSLPLTVTAGFFSAVVGSVLDGMDPIDPSLFSADQKYFLRVWFDDGTHGFERLTPDKRIVNPSLLGQQHTRSTTLYVDPVGGNDTFTGLRANKAKRTLQAAWDALPSLVRQDVTIKLANGLYRQSAVLSGKLVSGGKTISIEGNTTTPAQVVFSGATVALPTSTTLLNGLEFNNQADVLVKGIRFEYFQRGIYLQRQSTVQVSKCEFRFFGAGIITDHATLEALDSSFSSPHPSFPLAAGIASPIESYVTVRNCTFTGLPRGITTSRYTNLVCGGLTFTNVSFAPLEIYGSTLTFDLPNSSITNSPTGIILEYNSNASYVTSRVNYASVTTQVTTGHSSYSTP